MPAEQGQQASHQTSRRTLLRGALIAGAGIATFGGITAARPATANAATTPNPQPGWGQCIYCSTMFWVAEASLSHCASSSSLNGTHAVGSGTYNYDINNGVSGNGQSNPQVGWHYCTACKGMCWGVSNGYCMGTLDDHQGGPTVYALNWGQPVSQKPPPVLQANWRYCGKCALLYWQGPTGNSAGACPSGGEHTAGSPTIYDVLWSGFWDPGLT